MKVHWNVFWGYDGDTDTAGEILSARMDHMTLAFKNPFSKYQHGSNDGSEGEQHKEFHINIF